MSCSHPRARARRRPRLGAQFGSVAHASEAVRVRAAGPATRGKKMSSTSDSGSAKRPQRRAKAAALEALDAMAAEAPAPAPDRAEGTRRRPRGGPRRPLSRRWKPVRRPRRTAPRGRAARARAARAAALEALEAGEAAAPAAAEPAAPEPPRAPRRSRRNRPRRSRPHRSRPRSRPRRRTPRRWTPRRRRPSAAAGRINGAAAARYTRRGDGRSKAPRGGADGGGAPRGLRARAGRRARGEAPPAPASPAAAALQALDAMDAAPPPPPAPVAAIPAAALPALEQLKTDAPPPPAIRVGGPLRLDVRLDEEGRPRFVPQFDNTDKPPPNLFAPRPPSAIAHAATCEDDDQSMRTAHDCLRTTTDTKWRAMQDAWRTSVVAKVLAAGGAYEKASEIRDTWTFSVQPSLKNLHGTQATFEASDGTTVFKSDDEILRFLNLYTPRYKCRQRVRARYRRGPTYYAATVRAVRDNGTYDVVYEDGSQDECLEEVYLTPAMHGVSEAQTLAPGLLLSALSRVTSDTKPVKRSHHKMVTRYDDDDEYHEDDVSDDEEPIKRSRTSKSVDVKVPSSWAPSPWLARADPVDIAAALSQVASAARRRNAVRPRPQPLPCVCRFSRTSGYPRAPETQAGAQRGATERVLARNRAA